VLVLNPLRNNAPNKAIHHLWNMIASAVQQITQTLFFIAQAQ
jgi:hypothetical protein